MFDLVSVLAGPLATWASHAAGIITAVPPPVCPPCHDDPVLCAMRMGVSILRSMFWGAPC